MSATKLLYTTAEAAAVLGVKKTKLFELLRSGELESVRIGSARLVPVEACDALVERLRRHPDAVEQLLALVDDDGRIDVTALPSCATLADLEEAKRIISERRQAA